MPLTDDELSAFYRELSGSREDPRTCPPSEILVRAAAGDLEGAERDAVVAHIESCHTCAQDFRIAYSLEVAPQQTIARPSQFWRQRLFSQAVAASLAMVAAGLLAWNVRLQQRTLQLEEQLEQSLPAPQPSSVPAVPTPAPAPAAALQAHVNVPIIDLEPPSRVRGQESRRQAFTIPADASLITLIVNTETERRSTNYTLDLLDASGSTVWSGTGLRPGSDGLLSVALPASLLQSGDYVFSLVEASSGRTLHRYPIRVTSR